MKGKLNKDFETFKKEFKKWQNHFGLNGYQVYFYHEDIDCFANIQVDQNQMVATVKLDNKKSPDQNIKKSAKHEAIHLLIWRLEHMAHCRFLDESEIIEATEELVVRLQGLIE